MRVTSHADRFHADAGTAGLRAHARAFARDVLSKVAAATQDLPTALARFAATRPFHQQAVAAGFLRHLIPAALGGQGTGVVDMSVLAEEFHAVDVNVSLTLFGTILGLFPVLLGGTTQQAGRIVAPFTSAQGTPLAAFAFSEPGGSANSPAPAEGAHPGEAGKRSLGDFRRKEVGFQRHRLGGQRADLLTVVCRTDLDATPESGISVIAVQGPAEGIVLDRAIESIGHHAHLQPQFRLNDVRTPADHVIGPRGGGKALVEACFTGTAPIVGVFAVGLMRAAFEWALNFARTEKRGGAAPIISHQAVGYALADAKMAIEAVRSLSLRAAHAFTRRRPAHWNWHYMRRYSGRRQRYV